MVKRLLTLLFALIGLTSAWAANYGLKIGGVQLTSDNYTNITAAGGFSAVKSGTVTFNPTTKTLTLSNAVIEAEGDNVVAIDVTTSGSGYKLQLASGTTNSVSSSTGIALRLYDTDFTIEGTGAVTFTSPKIGIYLVESDAALTIRNCTLTATGGNSGITGSSEVLGSVTIDGATVRATGTARGSIWCFHTLTLSGGVEILSPEGAVWNTTYQCVCMPSNVRTPIKTEVVIGALAPEPETVEPERVLNVTRYDVDGSGNLTVADLTLLVNALVGKVNYPVTMLGLPASSYTLLVGQPKIIVPTVIPSNADYPLLAWTTSNKHVATVKDSLVAGRRVGVVMPQRVGTCIITASAIDGSNRSVSCDVTVKQGVSGITLSSTSLSLSELATHQLTATVLPSNAYNTSVTWSTSNALVATVSSTGLVTPTTREGTCTITCTANDGSGVKATCLVSVYWNDLSGTIDGHEYIDLGLPSRTLWAATNVGASSPEGYGNYYAWGETTTKTTYYDSNYFDYSDGNYIIYNRSGGLTELQTNHDAAYVNWGSNWCMPSNEQEKELRNYTERRRTSLNGVPGFEFTGKGGNTIFLPAAGYRGGVNLLEQNETGYYWTRDLSTQKVNPQDEGTWALSFKFDFSEIITYSWYRRMGFTVRPVRKQ